MDVVLIFFPSDIKIDSHRYLYGFFREAQNQRNKSIYVLGSESVPNIQDPRNEFYIVGFVANKDGIPSGTHLKHLSDEAWINVKYTNREVNVQHCSIKKKPFPVSSCLVVLYDSCCLYKSELFLHPQNLFQIDHFRILAENLKHRQPHLADCNNTPKPSMTIMILNLFYFINGLSSRLIFLTNYSSLSLHLMNYAQSIVWIFESLNKKEFINLKVGNYISSIILDIFAGLFVYCTVTSWKNTDGIFDSLTFWAENVIDSIAKLVMWLMVTPAGLKLNEPLANLLGSLVLYYLDIWRNFLYLVRPVLEFFFIIVIKLGFFGLTFQLATLTDIFAVMSFHVYCIYIYAARLYEIQAKGVHSLSRLVLGRKRNPEPGKVDSCPYSSEELLIGTISFAVLLFLLPTTLVFYVVFSGLRIGVLLIRGMMTRTIYFMQTLPVYSTLMWIFVPSCTATTVKLTPIKSNAIHGVLLAKLTTSSWFDTIRYTIPDAVPAPVTSDFGRTLSQIAQGKLI